MVTRESVELFVDLLHGWQNFLLREPQRVLFFIWLRDHTKTQIHPGTFREELTEWLLKINDPGALYSEVLIIHSEILWSSKVSNEITKWKTGKRNCI